MTKNEPKGVDLLAKLIDLLAEQEGVRIEYTIERSHTYERTESNH